MMHASPGAVRNRLTLDSRLAELARVQPWIAELAAQCGVGDDTRFRMEVCLEEVLSNIVRHGYNGEAGHAITIDAASAAGTLRLVIEDEAPPFEPRNPGDAAPVTLDALVPGGQGLRLLYRFAGSVAYERLAGGNRLTLEFPLAPQS